MTSERLTFEARLEAAFAAYAEAAPTTVDAVAMTHASRAAAGERSGRARLGGIGGDGSRAGSPMWRTASVVFIVLALLMAAVGVALVAGRLTDRLPSILPHPATADDLLVMMDMRRDPQDHACVDGRRITIATGAARPFLRCGDQVEFTKDGSRAAVGGLRGLAIVDTRDGSRLADLPTGTWTRPVGWSPSGRWIQTAECTPVPADICKLFIVAIDGSTRTEIPNVSDGGYVPAAWAPDESHLYVQGLEADADGSDPHPIRADDPVANTSDLGDWLLSPDGTQVAYAESGGVWVRGRNAPNARNLTTFPAGHTVGTLSWSPDGRTIAAIDVEPGVDPAVPPQVRRAVLRLIDVATGTSRIVETPPLQSRSRDGFVSSWAPDGRRLAVTMGNGDPAVASDRFSTSFDTVIAPVDGSAPAFLLRDARGAAWSPDARSIAYVATTGAILAGDGEPSPPAAIMVVDADGSNSTTVVAPADLVNPLGEPSPWFVWAAAD